MGCGATPEGVETPAIFVLARAGGPFITAVNNLPKALRLRRHAAGPADFPAEEPTNGERLVANHFRFEPNAWTASEETIIRIPGQQLRGSLRSLPGGGGSDNEFVHGFHVPAEAHEFGSQPVQQFRMGRRFALLSEFLNCFHN